MICPPVPHLSDLDRGEVLDGLVHVVDAVVDQHVGESHEPDTTEQSIAETNNQTNKRTNSTNKQTNEQTVQIDRYTNEQNKKK